MNPLNVDNGLMEEYPFHGEFYVTKILDEGASLIEQEEVTELVYETDCDIQQASILGNAGFKTSSYNVYFPLKEKSEWAKVADRFEDIKAKRGRYFRAEVWGYKVDGIVEGVGFSQLGGCVVQIKDRTE